MTDMHIRICMAFVLAFALASAANVLRAQDAQTQDNLPRDTLTALLVSDPPGAAVYLADSLLGHTPLAVPRAMASRLDVWDPDRSIWNARHGRIAGEAIPATLGVTLVRFDDGGLPPLSLTAIPPERAVEADRTFFRLPPARIILPAIAGLAAGGVAAMMKNEGDRIYARYLATGREQLLNDAEKYDIISGAALIVTELCLGYFVYLLLTSP
jgi:hypothetical protein